MAGTALNKLEWEVFHGSTRQAVPELQKLASDPAVPDKDQGLVKWLTGVALGASGQYGEALEMARSVPMSSPDYSMAKSLEGSLLRQLGCHDLALQADRQAMSSAATPGAAVEALTGLAADAVGLQDPTAAAQSLERARKLVDKLSQQNQVQWWRHLIRVEWVQCEVSLLNRDPAAAVAAAENALRVAENSNAPRHVAKSLLFLAVAQLESGEIDEAPALLRRCLALCSGLGANSIAWPCRGVLAAIVAPTDPEAAMSHLQAARAVADQIRAGLPEDLVPRWDARSDIAALRASAS